MQLFAGIYFLHCCVASCAPCVPSFASSVFFPPGPPSPFGSKPAKAAVAQAVPPTQVSFNSKHHDQGLTQGERLGCQVGCAPSSPPPPHRPGTKKLIFPRDLVSPAFLAINDGLMHISTGRKPAARNSGAWRRMTDSNGPPQPFMSPPISPSDSTSPRYRIHSSHCCQN